MNELKEVDNLKGKVFENGYEVLRKHGLVIIWMSVGNSYFDKERIGMILEYAARNFSSVRILVPSEPAVHTYLAFGYSEIRAGSKARLGSNRLTNHTKKIIGENPHLCGKDIKILNWTEDVSGFEVYQENLSFVTNLYKTNSKFRTDAERTTSEILSNKKGEEFSAEKVRIGVDYLLEEIAFVLSSPVLFKVNKTAYMYHRHWPIYEKLVDGEYDGKLKENVGFLLVNEEG